MKAHNWFLIIAVVALAWVFLRGGEERYTSRRSLDYDRLAVSEGLSPEAYELNLADDLDVSLLPEIGKQVIRETAQQGLREQAFLEQVIREVSNRVREISTIDLNGDDVADPILVRPEPQEGEQFVMLSLQVPAHDAYPLPAAADTEGWKSVDTVEVATMTVALDAEALTVQAQGNQHVYPNAAGQHYVARDTTSSFLSMYFTMRMMEWMFFPPMYGFWGPGYGYGGYGASPVGGIAAGRADTVSRRNYSRAPATTQSAVRSRTGGAPTTRYSRAYAGQPPRSLNQLRSSSQFRQRQAAKAVRSGGFGRTGPAVGRASSSFSGRSAARAPLRGSARAFRSPRGFGGRGFGIGRGGFRFRRCQGCWRGAAPTAQGAAGEQHFVFLGPGPAAAVIVYWSPPGIDLIH